MGPYHPEGRSWTSCGTPVANIDLLQDCSAVQCGCGGLCHVDIPLQQTRLSFGRQFPVTTSLCVGRGNRTGGPRTTPHETATPQSGQEPEAARAHAECATEACPHQHPSMPVNVDQQSTAGHAANRQDLGLECSFVSRAELKSAGGAALQHRKSRTDQASSRPQPRSSTQRSLLAPQPPAASSTPGFSQSGSDSCSTRDRPHPGQGHSCLTVAKLRGEAFSVASSGTHRTCARLQADPPQLPPLFLAVLGSLCVFTSSLNLRFVD